MNTPTPDEQIEALLGLLTPAPPDSALMSRLRNAGPGPSKTTRIIRTIYWTPLAAAAGIAFALVLTRQPGQNSNQTNSTSSAKRLPVESRQHLMEVTNLGVVRDKNRQPVRLVRTTWVDEIFYASGSAPESRVRQEIVPVSLTTY